MLKISHHTLKKFASFASFIQAISILVICSQK